MRTTRTARTLLTALAVPALAVPALTFAPAAGAAVPSPAPTAQQSVTTWCEPDLPEQQTAESATAPVTVNWPKQAAHTNAGRADAAQLTAAAYSQAEWLQQAEGEASCKTDAAFSNVVHVRPGTSGLAHGAEVTVRVTVDAAASLSTAYDVYEHSYGEAEADLQLTVTDPGADCGSFDCSANVVADLHAKARHRVIVTDPRRAENGYVQGLHRYSRTQWQASSTPAPGESTFDDGGETIDQQVCFTFPCGGSAVPGDNSGPLPPTTLDQGPQVLLFHTRVGAVLRVEGSVMTFNTAADGYARPTSDARPGLSASFADPAGELEIVVGQPSTDTTKPTGGTTASPEPNAAGWNSGPVDVTVTAQDANLSDVSWNLNGASTGSGSDPDGTATVRITEPGETQLSWTAKDVAGNTTSGSRTVKIDTQAPVPVVPAMGVSRPASADGLATVHFVVGATDDKDASPGLTCTHASGSRFPLGVTDVVCTARDHAGNEGSKQFRVTVTPADTVADHIAALRELVTLNPMDEVLRKQLLNDLVLLEKAYEKGRGATKGCKELDDLQARVTAATSISGGTRSVILARAGELDVLLAC